MNTFEKSINVPNEHIANIFGQFDCHAQKIEKAMNVTMIVRDDHVKVIGSQSSVERTADIINSLVELAERGNSISEQQVNYAISLSMTDQTNQVAELDKDIICHTVNGKPIKAKTVGQKQYLNAIDKNMIVFGIGPAGTGKTYLAMAKDRKSVV